jgi:hypothetical protein
MGMKILRNRETPPARKTKKRRLRAVAILPTLLTLGNMLCGFAAVYFCILGVFDFANGTEGVVDVAACHRLFQKFLPTFISVGGFLGMGARNIMVSLDELKPMGDKLQMSASKEQIAARKGEDLGKEKYFEVKGKTPIHGSIVEFSAFEQSKEPNKPGETWNTPKGDAVNPATAPETPKAPQ